MTREEFIKRKIKEKGVTLKDYARMINMPYSTLLSMLAGNLGGASLDNVVRICNGLDTNIGVLQSPNMDPSAENGMSNLSEREKKLVRQYRKAGSMQDAVDKLLEANGSDEAKALEGKAAVANARLAYELFENKFANDPRWAALEAKGAKKQRPLWASTGTKNAAYSDCKYVDELVAPFVVNTMPEKTLNALADHGNGAPSIKGTYEESHAIMNKLADLGINIKDVTDKLEADGVAAFIKSWDTVLADVQAGIDRVNG